MAETQAIYRAVADFSSLKRQADAARRSLRRLRDESSDTHQDYVEGQEEVTEATDDSSKANLKLVDTVVKVGKATRDTSQVEEGRVDVLKNTVAEIGKQTAAQRENTRIQIAANQAKERLTIAEEKYTRVAEDATATDRSRAKALDDVRLASIAASAANDQLVASMARLAVGGGGRGGRPRGPGIATDVGAFGRALATAGAGLVATLLLVTPTINVIIAGLVGIVALLSVAVVGAAAFAAAFAAVGVAMGIAAFRWRELLASSTSGVSEWRAAVLAIEAAAFNAFQGIRASFEDTGEAGKSMWDSIAEGGVILIEKVAPYIQKAVDLVANFVDALSGAPGAYSPFLEFLRTWGEEWKKLLEIVNQDILPGGPGFFEKYEAPAKAFVEGIAQVINAIRKFSRMGLGLNTDQLARFINNIFDVLSSLIGIIPRYSNALVKVGLATSKFVKSLIPLIDRIVKVGEVILKDMVAPLIILIEDVLGVLLKIPVLDWLIGLGGGFVLAAKGLSVLSFGLLKFGGLVTGRYLMNLINFGGVVKTVFQAMSGGMGVVDALANVGFPKLSRAVGAVGNVLAKVGTAITNLIPGVGDLSRKATQMIGGLGITAAIVATYVVLTTAMDALGRAEQRVRDATEDVSDAFAAGRVNIEEARKQIHAIAKEEAASAGFWTRLGASITSFGNTILQSVSFGTLGKDVETVLTQRFEAVGVEEFNKDMAAFVDNALASVDATGALTESQAEYLRALQNVQGGTREYHRFLTQVTAAYESGEISATSYATILEQLGVQWDEQGEKIDLVALKVEGAANTIAVSLASIGDEARAATPGITAIANALGEDVVQFTHDAVEAFEDMEGGLAGTGDAITEWFQETSDAILAWKAEVAESFDLVKQAFSDLGAEADLTWEKFKTGIEDAIEASKAMNENIEIISQWASPKLLSFIAEAGPAAAGIYDVLADRGKKGVQFANQALREGADLGVQTADVLGEALGLSIDRLTAAVEVMVAKFLDIPVGEVRKRVNELVQGANQELEDLRITPRERHPERWAREHGVPTAEPMPAARGGAWQPPEETIEGQIEKDYEKVGRAALSGMGVGMSDVQGLHEVADAGTAMANEAITSTNSALGIGSPSKVYIRIGKDVVAGFQEGITDPEGWNSAIGAVVSTLTGLKNTISEIFTNARSWLGGIIESFKNLYRVISEDLTPAVGDLKTALDNLPETVEVALDLDTSKAEAAATAFIEKMEKQGLVFQNTGPGGKQQLHEGGPAGHAGRFTTGRPRSDEVDARLQRGEYVFSRKSVQNMGGLGSTDAFHRFVQGKRVFHDGGPVDESEEVAARIAKVAASLGISGATATGILPKQQLKPEVSVSGPGAGKTPGGLTAAAANYMAVIKKNFPQITGYGTIAVRNIAGTNTWSQHAYGNAIDVMTGGGAVHQAVAFFSNQFRRILAIAHLLADPWFASPRGDHGTHVHADFNPQYGGTPPGQPYRKGGRVRKRGGRVHENEFVLRESAARSLGDSGLNYLNTHADRYGPAAFLEAFNQSFATSSIPRLGGVGGGAEGAGDRAMFSIAMHLDGKTVSKSVDVYSREADILLPGR